MDGPGDQPDGEFAALKQGLLGSPDFPDSGAINDLRRQIEAADANRKADVQQLHTRLDEQNTLVAQMPDVIVARCCWRARDRAR